MGSFSNGGLYCEVSNKRPLENGCLLKYKPRKVSAVRNFPPRCGPNAVPSNLRPEGKSGSDVGCTDSPGATNFEMTNVVVINSAETSVMANLVESEAVGNSKISKIVEIKDSEIQNVVDPKASVECQSHEEDGPSSSLTFRQWAAANDSVDIPNSGTLDKVMDEIKNVAESKKLVMEIRPFETPLQEEADWHKQEEVNNHIEIESDEPVDTYIGNVITTVINGLQNEVQDVMPEPDFVNLKILNPGGLTMSEVFEEDNCSTSLQNSGFQVTRSSSNDASNDKDLLLGNPMEFPAHCGSTQPETSINPKDKYRPRRVSAVRKFPPHCGTNALLPIEKEKEKSTLEKDSQNSVGGLQNIHVKIEENEMFNDGAGRGLLQEVTVSTAEGRAVEFKEYNGDSQHGITERTGSGTMSAALVNTNIEDAREPVGKEISVHSADRNDKDRPPCCDTRSESDLKKELVHCLMAAPYCSWKKSKSALKTHDGGTCDLKMKQKKRQKPKTDALNNNLEPNPSGCSSLKKTASRDSLDGDETPGKSIFIDEERRHASSVIPEVTPISMLKAEVGSSDNDEPVSKDIVVFSQGNSYEGNGFKKELVHALMAAPYRSWRNSKAALKAPDGGTDDLKMRQQNVPQRKKPLTDALNCNLKANLSGCSSLRKTASCDSHDGDETSGKSTFISEGDHCANSECIPEVTPISMYKVEVGSSDDEYAEPVSKNIVVCSLEDNNEGTDFNKELVDSPMTEPFCPLEKEKTLSNSKGGKSTGKKRKQNLSWRQKANAVAKKINLVQKSGSPSKKKNKVHVTSDVDDETHDLVLPDGDDDHDEDFARKTPATNKETDFEVSLPRFGPTRSGLGDARNKVRGVLQLFHTKYRKLLQQEEADPVHGMEGSSEKSVKKGRRHDLLVAQILKDKGEFVNSTKRIGPLPGVEVGDEFQYRVELAVVGIHFPYQSGIDSVKVNDVPLATSIVTSGAYYDDVKNADVLIYSGQGGNVIGKSKEPEDQKMERGNLALKNCIKAKTPVRVVRGWKEKKIVDALDVKPKIVTTYVYDGLYTVINYWTEKGPRGKQVFKFELKRNPGQPELAWKELKSNKSKIRPGVCVTDISGGKERIPICAVNTIDDDKPPPFNYTPKMIYPEWYSPVPPVGCSCTGRCSKLRKCPCAARNEGDIPYNHNGALVETKPLVYECGPHCKCPPSCYNRVTQCGIKFQLEVFKTESRGWGVRPLTSIPSGSFICEYAGELLEEKTADERIGSDEYLFDIGQNLIDEQAVSADPGVEKGYTIDALTYGNVGRFVNHSCLPNLHAQNVIYDNDDKSMPHIMLFAMENIPPLTELTYHYNYSLGQVYDSDGNVKVKKCYCGAVGCSGRMY